MLHLFVYEIQFYSHVLASSGLGPPKALLFNRSLSGHTKFKTQESLCPSLSHLHNFSFPWEHSIVYVLKLLDISTSIFYTYR